MGDRGKPVTGCNSLFQFLGKTILNLDHGGATATNQMMMVGVIGQFKAGNPIPKIESLNKVQLLEEVN
jgi:hypothetical protein